MKIYNFSKLYIMSPRMSPNITNSIQTIVLAIITMCGFYLVFRQLKSLENKIEKNKKEIENKIVSSCDVLHTHASDKTNNTVVNNIITEKNNKDIVWDNNFTDSDDDSSIDDNVFEDNEKKDVKETETEIETETSENDIEELILDNPIHQQQHQQHQHLQHQHLQHQHLPQKHIPPQHLPPQYMPQHLPPQHLPPQHLPPQHLPPQHLPPQHLPPQHLPPQHLPPQYLPPQQLPPQHLPPQHLPPQHLPPQQLPPQHLPPQQLHVEQTPQSIMNILSEPQVQTDDSEKNIIIEINDPINNDVEKLDHNYETQNEINSETDYDMNEEDLQESNNDDKFTLEKLTKLKIIDIKDICKKMNISISKGENKEVLIKKILANQ